MENMKECQITMSHRLQGNSIKAAHSTGPHETRIRRIKLATDRFCLVLSGGAWNTVVLNVYPHPKEDLQSSLKHRLLRDKQRHIHMDNCCTPGLTESGRF